MSIPSMEDLLIEEMDKLEDRTDLNSREKEDRAYERARDRMAGMSDQLEDSDR